MEQQRMEMLDGERFGVRLVGPNLENQTDSIINSGYVLLCPISSAPNSFLVCGWSKFCSKFS